MIESLDKYYKAKDYILSKIKGISPKIGVILGTGLSDWAEFLDTKVSISYEDIPFFPKSTVESHAGKLQVSVVKKVPVFILRGRFHLYEGYSPEEVCFGIRVLGLLGVKVLIITNAAGGLNPNFEVGSIMLIKDHINFQFRNPLVGPNVDEWGERFPDMSEPYDKRLQKIAIDSAVELKISLEKGVYIGVLGPSLETPAETRALRILGADAVGMSTIMEVICARHMKMRVLGFSCITNKNLPDCMKETSLEEIIEVAKSSSEKLGRLITHIIPKIDELLKTNEGDGSYERL